MRFMVLRQQLLLHKNFIKKLNRAKSPYFVKQLITRCSAEEVRVIQNLIVAHLDKSQKIPIPETSFSKLRKSKHFRLITSAFSPKKTLNLLHDARLLLLKIAPLIKIFTQNITN